MSYGYSCFRFLLVILAALTSAAPAQKVFWSDVGPPNNTQVSILQKVGIEQKLNAQVPLELTFRDEAGLTVPLHSYFGQRPVILTLVYYQCPMLCTQVLNGLVSAMLPLKLEPGRDFEIITVSINPSETPSMAAAKKGTYLKRYGRSGAARGWHFLTGVEPNISELANAIGFRYQYDPEFKQYAHASSIVLLTPDGHVAQYFYGIEYAPKDLRLGLVESSRGSIGSLVDQALLFCYHYDPNTGKYAAVVMNVLRLGGLLTILMLGGFFLVMHRRDYKPKVGR